MKIYVGNAFADINSKITSLQDQMNAMTVPDETYEISNFNDSMTNFQSQIDRINVPDDTNDINDFNNQRSTINQSITNLQNLIGDGIRIDLTNINDSIISVQDQIKSMNCPRLITTRLSILEINFKDVKSFVGNTVTSLQNQIESITVHDYTNEISSISDSILNLQSQIESKKVPD
jgi:hypothetical protein